MRDVNEPIEIRIATYDSDDNGNWHLIAYRSERGTVVASLLRRGEGIPNSLSNLQSKAPFPNKAVPGWQDEVLAFAKGGLGTVVEVR